MGLLEFLGETVAALTELSRTESNDKKGNNGCFWYALVIFLVFMGIFVWLNLN